MLNVIQVSYSGTKEDVYDNFHSPFITAQQIFCKNKQTKSNYSDVKLP